MIFEIAKAKNDSYEIQSRIEKVEAKPDKIVQEIGSKLENHSKIIKSLPSSTSAVEVKLNKMVQELGTKLDTHCKVLKQYHQMLQTCYHNCQCYILPGCRAKRKG